MKTPSDTQQTEFDRIFENEAQIIESEIEEELLDRRQHYVDLLLSVSKPLIMSDCALSSIRLQSFAFNLFEQAEFLVYQEISAKREKAFLSECNLMIKEREEAN